MENTKTKFFFKSRKEKDDKGQVVMVDEYIKDEKTGEMKPTGKKTEKVIPAAEPLEVEVPLLGVDDLVAILQLNDEKQTKLILESLNLTIIEQAREQVNQDPEAVREKGLDQSALSWAAIANLPPAQRRGAAIPDEKWDGFVKDYVEVMQHHGKTEEKAMAGAKLLRQKYQPVKGNKKVIQALKDNLQVWYSNTTDTNREEYQDVYENLVGKADTLLEKDEDAIVAAI